MKDSATTKRCSAFVTAALAWILLGGVASVLAQQKGQWVPGQFELNAGVIPSPGITYANEAFYYSAGQLNGPNGNGVQGITGTHSFWADENIFYYVPSRKFLGAYYMLYIALTWASGSVVADVTGTNLSTAAGGSGFSDMALRRSHNHDGHRRSVYDVCRKKLSSYGLLGRGRKCDAS